MISEEEIEHLKDLARVEFGKTETKKLAKDLGEILGYVDRLKKADVSSALEMTHALEGVKNVFRKDEKGKDEGGLVLTKDLINAFPEKENNYLKVQAIL
ncbi:MAG: Asp-tRNA(Asn)/Glu-tRNA(Gln) amidotransferase subunit GatC [Candidatus Giovannonibacteria bacterium]|nr:MAG: Asp-tRNA(Asn)/Glu-tRNA(Gln) amidotransferase subunit GatC [Candidatus Giovannonibacteria bacterium]